MRRTSSPSSHRHTQRAAGFPPLSAGGAFCGGGQYGGKDGSCCRGVDCYDCQPCRRCGPRRTFGAIASRFPLSVRDLKPAIPAQKAVFARFRAGFGRFPTFRAGIEAGKYRTETSRETRGYRARRRLIERYSVTRRMNSRAITTRLSTTAPARPANRTRRIETGTAKANAMR